MANPVDNLAIAAAQPAASVSGADEWQSTAAATVPATFRARIRLRVIHLRAYHLCEFFTAGLIYFVLISSPWLFGTTQPAAIQVMNAAGLALGGLLLVKQVLRSWAGYCPMRWGANDASSLVKMLTRALGALTVCILAYCLIAALNARAMWRPATNSFDYFNIIPWLPSSYNRAATWQVFWNYLALACVFWAMRDWLLGLTAAEEQSQRVLQRGARRSFGETVAMPARLRRLLWVLSINGAVLGIEGIAQRMSGTSKLLWFMPTHINREAIDQFGPFAYRSNAAQYFNLLWPVVLGFWWTLHRGAGLSLKRWRHHALLVCGVIMAACPVISTTRGGALVTAGLIVSIAVFLALSAVFFRSNRAASSRAKLVTYSLVGAFFIAAGWIGMHFGWADLQPRMIEIDQGYAQREQTYTTARQMARDYPVFGTGPGTFDVLFQLYRSSPDEYWPAQLHDDWLETRITWGWLGSTLMVLAFLMVLARWFAPGGIHGGRRFVVITWLALAGCLAHGRFDFPFQIYSILLLFVALCAVLFTVSRRA